MTPDVFDRLRRRYKLYHHFCRDSSESNWIAYKQARNSATYHIRIAKQKFLMEIASDSRNFWKTISRSTGLGRKRHTEPPWPRSSPSTCRTTANAVNNCFVTTVAKIASTFSSVTAFDEQCMNSTACFTLQPITIDDVMRAVATYYCFISIVMESRSSSTSLQKRKPR